MTTEDKQKTSVQTYYSEIQARIAQLNLESMGIESWLKKDDCGGAYLQLQFSNGVHLLVNEGKAEKAHEILQEMAEEESREATPAVKPPTRHQTTGFVFLVGLLAGVLIATGIFKNTQKEEDPVQAEIPYDFNGDGITDETHYYEKGLLTKIHEDRNADGNVDMRHYYDDDRITRGESDDNFDGRADGWTMYTDHNNFTAKYDTNFDRLSDATYYYENGLKQRIDWHPGESERIARRILFVNGVKNEEHRDTDNDGAFDLLIRFDSFEREVDRQTIRQKEK